LITLTSTIAPMYLFSSNVVERRQPTSPPGWCCD
jgi:hypothetical protein